VSFFLLSFGAGLGDALVSGAPVVLLAVAEDPVDGHAEDGEEEDDEAPGDLSEGVSVGFEDLDEDENIQDEDDEAENAATGAITPGVAVTLGDHGLLGHGKVREEGDEEGEDVEHFDGCLSSSVMR